MATHSLITAAESGDTSTLVALLASGQNVDAHTASGETALMRAAANGHTDAVRLLLNGGAEVNEKRGDGLTALISAAFSGHSEVVGALLRSGADTDTADLCGMTAQEWALSKGHMEIASLLANGATISTDHRSNAQSANHDFVPQKRDTLPFESSHRKALSTDSLSAVRTRAAPVASIKIEKELPLFSLPQASLNYWRLTMIVFIAISVIGGAIYISARAVS